MPIYAINQFYPKGKRLGFLPPFFIWQQCRCRCAIVAKFLGSSRKVSNVRRPRYCGVLSEKQSGFTCFDLKNSSGQRIVRIGHRWLEKQCAHRRKQPILQLAHVISPNR
jgi:hypothetical protein